MLKLVCPECGGTHARKLSLIYTEGITTGTGTMESVGTFNTIGRQQIYTKGTSTSFHQTDASRAAAPPEVPRLVTRGEIKRNLFMVGGLGVGAIAGGLMYLLSRDTEGAFVAFLIFAVGLALWAQVIDRKPQPGEEADHRNKHRAAFDALERWEHTFSCNSCGSRFIPSQT